MTAIRTTSTKDAKPQHDVPDDLEPGVPPIEPDEGPVPAMIPEDPEHDRLIDPADSPDQRTEDTRTHAEID